MSCCGGNCGCGSACKCGSGCNGCGMYPDLSSGEIMLGSTASELGYGYENMTVGAENDCKCATCNCTCDTCNCDTCNCK